MSRKISADITDENSEALNKDKEVSGRTYSKTINQLIQIFLRSPDIHDELIAICKSQIRKRSELIQTGAVINQEVQKLKNGNFVYLNMLRILTGNMNLTLKNVLSEERMRSIRLANGYLICSNRILLVNESDANKWHFACQIEVIGAGFETPIFMFLSDKKASEYTDEMLHHLNDVIKTVDPDYPLGTREFGERSKYIFAHWSELYQYSEIYIALATIIECEKVYYPLDAFTTISLIKQLDRAIMESSNIAPVKEPFAINISNRDRYYGIRYEITMYYTHIGYSILSGDGHCENISSGFQAFLLKVVNINTPPDPITEDNIDAIAKLETEGRRLLKQLAAANN